MAGSTRVLGIGRVLQFQYLRHWCAHVCWLGIFCLYRLDRSLPSEGVTENLGNDSARYAGADCVMAAMVRGRWSVIRGEYLRL